MDTVAELGDVADRVLDEHVLVADEDAADDLRHCSFEPEQALLDPVQLPLRADGVCLGERGGLDRVRGVVGERRRGEARAALPPRIAAAGASRRRVSSTSVPILCPRRARARVVVDHERRVLLVDSTAAGARRSP